MKNRILIAIVAGLLVVGGGTTAIILTSQNNKEDILETDVTKPTTFEKVGYLSDGVSLLKEGSCEYGEFQYSLDKTTWLTNIPKGTEIGEYEIYWYIKGDKKHNDFGNITDPFKLTTEVVNRNDLQQGLDLLAPSINNMALIETDTSWPLLGEPVFFDSTGLNDAKFYYGINVGTTEVVVNEWSTNIPTVSYNEVKTIIENSTQPLTEVVYNVAWYFSGGTSVFNSIGSPQAPICQNVTMTIQE